MSIHLAAIQKATSKAFFEVDKDISFLSNSYLVSVQYENVITNGVKYSARRLFLDADDSGEYRGCGWILKDDVKQCMVFGDTFDGLEVLKNNCRACGNVVCNHCSPETAIIAELLVNEPQKVCMLCFWGQDIVEATLQFTKNKNLDRSVSDIENSIDSPKSYNNDSFGNTLGSLGSPIFSATVASRIFHGGDYRYLALLFSKELKFTFTDPLLSI